MIASIHFTEDKHHEFRSAETKDLPNSSENGDEKEDNLVQEEDRKTGVINTDVYKTYWFAVGSCLSSCVLIALFLMQGQIGLLKSWDRGNILIWSLRNTFRIKD